LPYFISCITISRHAFKGHVISDEHALEYLLGFDGRIYHFQRRYWLKFEIKRVKATPERPHGLRYAFTLHDPEGNRLISWEFPRLCRGGSKNLTFPVVALACPPMTLECPTTKHTASEVCLWPKKGIIHSVDAQSCGVLPSWPYPPSSPLVPRVPPLGGSDHWGRVAPPIAALSGSPPKAPGSAGGYLLGFDNAHRVPPLGSHYRRAT
jgi:hypothetical protein